MACGVPVVASNATSIPEVVGDGGWLLPPDDIGAWAEAMIRLASSEENAASWRNAPDNRAGASPGG
jgi:glycosyltransferase involved in cell wall biosynthesis